MREGNTILEHEKLPSEKDRLRFRVDKRWRVKLFHLNDKSEWYTCGTGTSQFLRDVSSKPMYRQRA
jgi:hypothetical protein